MRGVHPPKCPLWSSEPQSAHTAVATSVAVKRCQLQEGIEFFFNTKVVHDRDETAIQDITGSQISEFQEISRKERVQVAMSGKRNMQNELDVGEIGGLV